MIRVPRLVPEEERYLTRDEMLVLARRRHASVLVRPVAEALGATLVAALLTPPSGGNTFTAVLWWAVLALYGRVLWYGVQWWFDHIVITDRRIFEMSGVLTRSVASMPLRKVTDMTYRRSLTGRVLGFGELLIESAGQDQALSHLDHLPDPDRIYQTLTGLVFGGDSDRDSDR